MSTRGPLYEAGLLQFQGDETAQRSNGVSGIVSRVKVRHYERLGRGEHQGVFASWGSDFKLPIVLLIEVATLVFYTLFGYYHQNTAVAFGRDFSLAVNAYLLGGLGFENGEGDVPGMMSLYFRSEVGDTANTFGTRLMGLAQLFPCGRPINFTGVLDLMWVDENDEVETGACDNASTLSMFVSRALASMSSLVISGDFVLPRLPGEASDMTLTIRGEFDVDPATRVVDFFVRHVQNVPKLAATQSLLVTPGATLPAIIGFGAILAIVFRSIEAASVWRASQRAHRETFEGAWLIFRRRVDGWLPFALVTHLATIGGCVLYLIKGTSHRTLLPGAGVVLAISSALHWVLMISYLRQTKFAGWVVNVTLRGGAMMLQFLLGCIVIFGGYLVLGMCLFGSFADSFASPLEGARSLIAVIHGDSIFLMFQKVFARPDISVWAGFWYWLVWTFFSLWIMFNISVSIFEEALHVEMEGDDAVGSDGAAPAPRPAMPEPALSLQIHREF